MVAKTQSEQWSLATCDAGGLGDRAQRSHGTLGDRVREVGVSALTDSTPDLDD